MAYTYKQCPQYYVEGIADIVLLLEFVCECYVQVFLELEFLAFVFVVSHFEYQTCGEESVYL